MSALSKSQPAPEMVQLALPAAAAVQHQVCSPVCTTRYVNQCAPPGMFQSKCTSPGGPIPPLLPLHCTSSPSSNSNPCPISFRAGVSQQTRMSCLKEYLQSHPNIYSADDFFLPFPHLYSYDQPTELPICLLQKHQCTFMFSPSHNLLLKCTFSLEDKFEKPKMFTQRPIRVGHQQILRTHCAV